MSTNVDEFLVFRLFIAYEKTRSLLVKEMNRERGRDEEEGGNGGSRKSVESGIIVD